MTLEIVIVLLLLVAAIVLFLTEWVSVDVATLSLLVVLVLTGVLTPAEAFAGFASEIVVILASIFVITGGLLKTGVVEWIGRRLEALIGRVERVAIVSLMAMSAATSSMLSNTSSTAILVPAVAEFSRRTGIDRRRLLMPLAYASMLGGTCTVIGTSTNLAASGLFTRLGLRPISLFEFGWVGLAMVVVGTAYMALAWPVLASRVVAREAPERARLERYFSQVLVAADSPFVGQTIAEMGLGERGVTVLAIVRGERRLPAAAGTVLQPDDLLLVAADRERLLELKADQKVLVEEDAHVEPSDMNDDSFVIAEAIVLPQSPIIGWSLKRLHFRSRFGLSIIGIHRRERLLGAEVGDIPLEAGDVLLAQGLRDDLHALEGRWDVRLLEEIDWTPPRRARGLVALGALAAAVVLGGAGVVPLSIGLLVAAIVVVLLRCIAVEEVYEFVDWRLIVLIAGMTSFGTAMLQSGAADFLATSLVGWIVPFGHVPVMIALIVLTMALTQPMSNAAAALVMLPIAVSTAGLMGVEPRSLAIVVTLAASLSFIAPLEPACLLVYSAGGYRFRDFVRAGLPLSVIAIVVLVVLVPRIWPLV